MLTISFTPRPFRRALRDELLLILAPTGQRLSAQGWRGATTLGNRIHIFINPIGIGVVTHRWRRKAKKPFARSRTDHKYLSKANCLCDAPRVLDLAPFQNLPLRGGFSIAEVHLTAQPLLDPLERAATAQTIIRGIRFHIFLRADLDERELSVSLYHEVLEAATVAADQPPEAVLELNEAEFETAAQSAHTHLGIASPASLNQMLAEFGF